MHSAGVAVDELPLISRRGCPGRAAVGGHRPGRAGGRRSGRFPPRWSILGRTHAGLTAALLSTLATVRLGEAGDPRADLWARIGKAHGVETALAAVDELVPLVGAAGFTAASPLAKARADLGALQYAAGIHDSLYRSGGNALLGTGRPLTAAVTTLPVPAGPDTVLPASA
jgi:alkylation response protein AidB-like acyl-CoA dehydrogenase